MKNKETLVAKKKYILIISGAFLGFLLIILLFIAPLPGPILVEGEITSKDNNSLTITFRNSSAFWDESDIGEIGSPLKLVGANDIEQFNIGDEIIAKGEIEKRGTLEISKVYPSYFQPLGVDWKTTAKSIFILIFLIVFYLALKRRFLSREFEQ